MPRFLKAVIFLGLLLFAAPAFALDCKSPEVKADNVLAAICANPQLKEADDAMNAAYLGLFRGRDKQQQRVLKALQVSWLSDERGVRCTKDPVDTDCFLASIRLRTDFLKGADGTGPMTQGKLTFKGFYVPRQSRADTVVNVSLFEFETPDTDGKKGFNAAVEKILADKKAEYPQPGKPAETGAKAGNNKSDNAKTGNNKAGEDDGDQIDCSSCEDVVTMHQPYQMKDFISAEVNLLSNDGGLHGYEGWSWLNFFLDRNKSSVNSNKPVAFGDFFKEYDASAMADLCDDQVRNGDADAGEGDYYPSNAFMQTFRDLQNWEFRESGIEVNFGLYVLGGGFGAGAQSCNLSYEALKPHLTGTRNLPIAAK